MPCSASFAEKLFTLAKRVYSKRSAYQEMDALANDSCQPYLWTMLKPRKMPCSTYINLCIASGEVEQHS